MDNTVGQAQTVQIPNYSGVNIQIFNPTVAPPGAVVQPATINTTSPIAPAYPANYYTQNFMQQNIPEQKPQSIPTATTVQQPASLQPIQALQPAQYATEAPKRKTEIREVVELTDNYVKSLENYLNNQDKKVRLIGAKEVVARLQEDDSRKNDEALNNLLNKMLKDPYPPIKLIAMGAFETKAANGNEESIELLKSIQKDTAFQGEDALKASNALLKMVGTTTNKEFDITHKPVKSEKSKK